MNSGLSFTVAVALVVSTNNVLAASSVVPVRSMLVALSSQSWLGKAEEVVMVSVVAKSPNWILEMPDWNWSSSKKPMLKVSLTTMAPMLMLPPGSFGSRRTSPLVSTVSPSWSPSELLDDVTLISMSPVIDDPPSVPPAVDSKPVSPSPEMRMSASRWIRPAR